MAWHPSAKLRPFGSIFSSSSLCGAGAGASFVVCVSPCSIHVSSCASILAPGSFVDASFASFCSGTFPSTIVVDSRRSWTMHSMSIAPLLPNHARTCRGSPQKWTEECPSASAVCDGRPFDGLGVLGDRSRRGNRRAILRLSVEERRPRRTLRGMGTWAFNRSSTVTRIETFKRNACS